MRFLPEIILCPVCRANKSLLEHDGELVCSQCGTRHDIRQGIPNLVMDKQLRTRLERIPYDSIHSIDKKGRMSTYEAWAEVIAELGMGGGRLLEIGSGTGNLTWGLMSQSAFDEIHVTDLSGTFLSYIFNNFSSEAKTKTYYYACDANRLPFRNDSFDIIVGHSVLHHLIDYEATLEQAYSILKKKGCAVFFEPVIQGKLYVSFLIDLIQRVDKTYNLGKLSEEDRRKIIKQVKHHTKNYFTCDDKNILRDIEDKYIFDVKEMRKLSESIGFSSFVVRQNRLIDKTFKSYVAVQWKILGLDIEKLAYFDEFFQAFGNTLGMMLGNDITTPMCYLIFRK